MDFFAAPNLMLQMSSSNDDDDQQNHHHPQRPAVSIPPALPKDHYFNGISERMLGKRSTSFRLINNKNNNINHKDKKGNNNIISDCSGVIDGGTEDDQQKEDNNLSEDEEGGFGSSQLLLGSIRGGSRGGEKKRRLNIEQLRILERNFELGNKLESDRKLQLAKALGLQPRQVAIWFQNRRARWKNKRLEKDYELLKRRFDSLKADNEDLQIQNHKLQSEILTLRGRDLKTGRDPKTESFNLNNKDTDQGSCSNSTSEVKFDTIFTTTIPSTPIPIQESPIIPNMVAFFPPSSSSPLYNNEEDDNNNDNQCIRSDSSNNNRKMNQFFHDNGQQILPDQFHYLQQTNKFNDNHSVSEREREDNGFTTMFAGIDDHTTIWPWTEQPNFH